MARERPEPGTCRAQAAPKAAQRDDVRRRRGWRVRHCHTASRSVHDPRCHRLYASRRRSRGTVPPIDGLTISYLPVFETRPFSAHIWRHPPSVQPVSGVSGRCWMLWGARAYDVGGNSTHGGYARCLADVFRHLLARARPVIIWSMEAFPKNEVVIPPKTPSKTTKPTSPVSPDSNFPRLVRSQVHSPHLHDWRHSRGRSHDARRGAESPVTSGWG